MKIEYINLKPFVQFYRLKSSDPDVTNNYIHLAISQEKLTRHRTIC